MSSVASWRSSVVDLVALATIVPMPLVFARVHYDLSLPPFEDAAMLMRYARHSAAGHGIVWNVGEAPVDGATDFLFMLVVAALHWAGVSLETAVRCIGFGSHVATIAIVFLAVRRVQRAGLFAAWLSAAYLAIGPGVGYTAAYFGTPFFALFTAVTWCLAHRLLAPPGRHAALVGPSGRDAILFNPSGRDTAPLDPSGRDAALFALSGLVMGLIRPEGVFLAGFMLLAIVGYRGLSSAKRVVAVFCAVFVGGGGAYFLWRWAYFGQPLPNPFYKKGGGAIYLDSLVESIGNTVTLGWPFLIVIAAGLAVARARRYALFAAIPVVGFTGIWILLSHDVNYLMRFQYATLPVVLISWPRVWRDLADAGPFRAMARAPVAARAAVAVAVAAALLVYQHAQYRHIFLFPDGRYDLALRLRSFAERGYTLATTEAGLLPLYSEWRALDTWGLNDRWVARNGGITAEYLERYKPELLMIHNVRWTDPGPLQRQWMEMCRTLEAYARANGYVLAAAFGVDPGDTHDYYVRPDGPDRAALMSAIRTTPYAWYHGGGRSRNFAPDR